MTMATKSLPYGWNPAAAADLAIPQSHLEEYAIWWRRTPSWNARDRQGALLHRAAGDGQALERPRLLFDRKWKDAIPTSSIPKSQNKSRRRDTIRPILIVRYVTMAGEEGLWPVKLDPPDGQVNSVEHERAGHSRNCGEWQVGSDCIVEKTLSASGVEEDARGGAAEVHGPSVHRPGRYGVPKGQARHYSQSRNLGRSGKRKR